MMILTFLFNLFFCYKNCCPGNRLTKALTQNIKLHDYLDIIYSEKAVSVEALTNNSLFINIMIPRLSNHLTKCRACALFNKVQKRTLDKYTKTEQIRHPTRTLIDRMHVAFMDVSLQAKQRFLYVT